MNKLKLKYFVRDGVIMMKKSMKLIGSLLGIFICVLIIYPYIEIDLGNKLYVCNYTGDFSEFDKNHSYNEVYCYNEERDISLKGFDVNNFMFFYVISMEYVKGDIRETEFMLEESYITYFLENAKIENNENNIDLQKLVDGKEAVVSNTRYTGNDYENGIYYELDGNYEELYVFYVDDLLVIQVGSPDELPKFIAYK